MASLLRLADAGLRDAELLSSGRRPDNAPALLQLAADQLVRAVLTTEHGWPLRGSGADPALIPGENPLREAVAKLAAACRTGGPPAVADTGDLPAPPEAQELHANILAARAVLKNLAATFEVDLFGAGVAGRIAPVRPVVAQPVPAPGPAKPVRPKAAPAEPPVSRPTRIAVPQVSATPAPEPHEVEGRAAMALKQASASMASTPFWTLMDRWNIPDQAALDLIGHPGGLTKKGGRPRFKLVGEEAALLRSFQEIDAALRPLGLDPTVWLHRAIKAAPFAGATPAAYLTSRRMQGVQDTLRFILQHGLRLSMSSR